MTARLVVLVSGEGSNLQALLDACREPDYGAQVVAVGADRSDIGGLRRAAAAGIPAFVVRLADAPDRDVFNERVAKAIASFAPDLVVLAGYMKILAGWVVSQFPTINTHPALLPAFPGAHAVPEALEHGVRLTGVTVHFAADDVDSGPIIAQAAVPVVPDDDAESLHERIKLVERPLLVDTVHRLVTEDYRIDGRRVVFV
ncbi:MAG: phosphoribosylglycinamide formyltransferase [Mycobacteriales bacterium]